MRTLYLLLLLLAAVLAAVTVLNWEAFVAPTELSLGIASVSLPLGLTLLSLLVLLTVLFLVHAVYLQGTVLLDTRRHSKELQANRELADKAEASRFTALQEFISTELTRQAMRQADAHQALLARIAELEQASQTFTEQTGNSLAASLGELEDRLERGLPAPRR